MIITPIDPVFENDSVAVYYEARGPGRIMVTFAHMDFPSNEGRYWGKVVLERSGLSALGFVSKRNDWFPRESLLPAMEIVAPLLSAYKDRIAYGFSMGAYAAAKHSALIRPTHVLALSPQWSIDPEETSHFDMRLARFYDANRNAGMAIRLNDVWGRLTILYDPYVLPDVEHATRISHLFEDATIIPIPRIGHETIDMLASSEILPGVVEAVLADDQSKLRTILSRRRRSNGRRLISLILALRRAHPNWAQRVEERHRHALRSDLLHLLDKAPA